MRSEFTEKDLVTPAVSALQRRLAIAESRPGEPWSVLVENVPCWPEGTRPESRTAAPDSDAAPYFYAPSQGLPVLREAIARRECELSGSAVVHPSNIVVGAGGMHALGLVFRDSVARGYRKAVCQAPVFRGVHDAMLAAGLSVETLPLTGTADDWDGLDLVCREPTVLYVNFPHNPTGATAVPGYPRFLSRFADTHDVLVVYDAVYDSFSFGPEFSAAPVDLAVNRTDVVVVNSMSKNYGRPGDRIGWITGHEGTVGRLVPRLEWEAVSINSRAQQIAADIIGQGNAALVEGVRAGRDAIRQSATGHKLLDAPLPNGGTQLWLDLRMADVEAFADFALDEYRLVLTTSENYAPVIPGFIRFPTGLAPRMIREGLALLDRAMDAWEVRQRT
ncbi:beta-methylarginine biosynthesis bifunctional aminotransferase [Streptomyces lonegramiae]|uniref:Beta-methylarginine biosynthesis bifunctional aminotransferase n=1 Tax=Streptomyces lonegramiae TaxID=3075524 RepID=A0ABU2X7F3_9ACTN|nr:beta-methylarginine biosynthesis bifunctional aminotransferase [Streptomyces sp. DSM 41529]MDT0541364.1 beta-methylarginine biosynthesis bifunctional aminotransferase [Streptomyces sp. DSM 41529]